MRKLLIVIILVFVALSVWFFNQSGDAKTEQTAILPQVELVKYGDLSVEVNATGVIEPINKVEIKSKASGLIEEMRVEEADPVKRCDLIARLDQRDTQNMYDQSVADLDVAEATVKQRQSDFERKKELFDKGLISATDFDQTKLALVDGQAQVVRAKINLDNNDIRLKDTVVRSPMDGIILTKDVEVGQIISSGISSVSGGTLIATVADMRQVYVKTDVDEVDIGKIVPGQRARVVADAYPDQVFWGEVIRIAAQSKVVQNVTTFEVTIRVDNPNARLKAGMNAAVEIQVADKRNILLVSNEALMSGKELQQEIAKLRMLSTPSGEKKPEGRQANQTGTPAPGSSGVANQEGRLGVILKEGSEYNVRMVRTGINNLDFTEILEGLKEGDQVVYTFFSRAKESGMEFRQRMSSMNNMRSGFRN